MIGNYPDIKKWHQKQTELCGAARAYARLRHKIALAVYHMLKYDQVFDMDKFLGKTYDRAENHSQQWMETSGQKSKPISLKSEHPSDLSKTKNTETSAHHSILKKMAGRVSLRSTGRRNVLTKA
jgi:hypothetical protein